MAYARRTDENQSEIIRELMEHRLFRVIDLSAIGKAGVPDLLVAGYDLRTRRYANVLVEVKTDRGKLSSVQDEFINRWPGPVIVVRSVEDVLAWFGYDERGL